MSALRSQLIRLAHERPDLRPLVLPLLREAAGVSGEDKKTLLNAVLVMRDADRVMKGVKDVNFRTITVRGDRVVGTTAAKFRTRRPRTLEKEIDFEDWFNQEAQVLPEEREPYTGMDDITEQVSPEYSPEITFSIKTIPEREGPLLKPPPPRGAPYNPADWERGSPIKEHTVRVPKHRCTCEYWIRAGTKQLRDYAPCKHVLALALAAIKSL